jgi:hypothetical protein
VQWELVREGIDDYRYLAALERLIEAGNGSETERLASRRFVENLRDSIRLDENGFVENWAEVARQAAGEVGGSDPFVTFKDRLASHIKILAASSFSKEPSLADFDGDADVDFTDFLSLVRAFGARPGHSGWDAMFDLDGDQEIGFGDILSFARAFGWPTTVSKAEDVDVIQSLSG